MEDVPTVSERYEVEAVCLWFLAIFVGKSCTLPERRGLDHVAVRRCDAII